RVRRRWGERRARRRAPCRAARNPDPPAGQGSDLARGANVGWSAGDVHPRGAGARVIRLSGPAEADTHFAIQRAACVEAFPRIFPPELYPFPDDEVLRRWRDFAGVVLVAERDGTAVGIAGVEACWLHGFYVLPE